MRFILSFTIFALLWLPMVLISAPTAMLMLLSGWGGKTTWFGNLLYGKAGNSHTPKNPTLWDSWWFLVVRNPVSNFGKCVLSYSRGWLVDSRIGKVGVLYGWKNPDPRIGNKRPFVFRPYIVKDTNG